MKKPVQPKSESAPAAPEYEEASAKGAGFDAALGANNARQGVTGHGVRTVLAVSLLGAMAAFVWLILWVY